MSLGLRGKTVYVYGLGLSGKASIDALVNDGARVLAWDDRQSENEGGVAGFPSVLMVSPVDLNWKEVDAVLKSPGISYKKPILKEAVARNIPIIGDIDLLYRRSKEASFIGITGTNGKSTTSALISHVLACAGYDIALGGNIGNPALMLPKLEEKGIYVLEISSYQLEMIEEIKLDSAVFINLSPDHLDRHGEMESYMATKMRIFDCCEETAVKVVGVDQKCMRDGVKKMREEGEQVSTFTMQGVDAEYRVTKTGKLMQDGKQLADLSYFVNLPGSHNWQNIVAAMVACESWVEKEEFFKHMRSFMGLPHRLERIQELNGVIFVNDSKATNPESAICALKSYKNIYWIAGGQPKKEGVVPCLEYIDEVRAAFVIGEAEEDFAEKLEPHVPVFKCSTLDIAVREAYAAARQEELKKPVVLMAPACASFDQFPSFEHRGDMFATLCRELYSKVNRSEQV